MKVSNALVMLIVLLWFFSCGGGDKAPGMENGVRVVRNGGERVYKKIPYVEKKVYGGTEQTPVLERPRLIGVSGDGFVYVLDYKKETVLRFDPELNYLNDIGSSGQGPGEFLFPLTMNIDNKGRVWVADSYKRLNIFNPDGSCEKNLTADFGIEDIYVHKGSGLVTLGWDKSVKNKSPKHLYDGRSYYFLGDIASADEMAPKEFYTREKFPVARVMRDGFFFEVPTFVRFTGFGDRIYVGSGDKYEITVFGKDRKPVLKILKEVKKILLTSKEQAEVKRTFKTFPGLEKRLLETAGFHPFMRSIAVDPKGRIWVEVYKPYREWKDARRTDYDLFSPEGEYVATLYFDCKVVAPLVFRGNHVYCIAEDDRGDVLIKKLALEDPTRP